MRKRMGGGVLCTVMALSMLLTACRAGQDGSIGSTEQLNDPAYTVGVAQGASGEIAARAELPRAELAYYTEVGTPYLAVQQGKLDAFVFDRVMLEFAIADGLTGVRILDEDIGAPVQVAVGISHKSDIPRLKEQVNAFLTQLEEDGTLAEMRERWMDPARDVMPDIKLPEAPEHTLRVGTTGSVQPFTYYKGTQLSGLDVELAYRLAAWLDMGVTFKIYDFDGLTIAAETGAIDCILSNLNVTAERAQGMDFSDPVYTTQNAVLVRDPSASATVGFWAGLKGSFVRTFVTEGRWRLIVSGMAVTALISVLFTVLGTLLGFVLCLLRRGKHRLVRPLIDAVNKLLQGLPVVVLLLILNYIVFAKARISGITVSVIGLSILFGSEVCGMLSVGLEGVDKGELEAATALGYSPWQVFAKVGLPQAVQQTLPLYKGQLVSYVKLTSIVGYIAVQDLTRAGDIIRSRTLEAFFPLIVIAVLYFLLSGLLLLALGRVEIRLDPKRRARTVEGVKPQ